jgi:multiple sugar transport system substrate-binding protein
VTKVATVVVQGKRTPVKVLHFYADGPRRDMFDEFTGAFNRESQNFTVEPTYLPFNNMIEKTMAGIAANDAPEVIYTNSMSHPAGTWAVDGTIRQLDAYYEKSKLPTWDAKTWVPYGIAEGQCTRQGKKYGIPWTPDTRFMFMDVAAFEEAGLDVKKPPQTWDDLKAIADKLDKGKKGDWKRITFCPIWGNQFDFQWTWSIPYDHLERMDKDNIPLVDQPEIRETWNFFLWWRDRYSKADLDVFRAGFTGTMDPYIGGVNPIQIHGSWMPARYTTINAKFRHAWALHPKHPGTKAVFTSWGDGAATVLPNKSKNPDGGWAWVEFCLDKERLSRWSIVTGTFGPRLDAMMVPDVAAKTGAHWPLAVEQLSKTRARGQYHGIDVHWETFKGLQEVWDGKKTMDQALKDKQDELRTRILDWRKTHPGMY